MLMYKTMAKCRLNGDIVFDDVAVKRGHSF